MRATGVILLVLSAFLFSFYLQAQDFNTVKSKQGVLILEGRDSVLFFQALPKDNGESIEISNYIHPLWGIGGGVITEEFPKDHVHHRGIFWAWHQFYIGDKSIGDSWICENVVTDVKKVKVGKSDDQGITFSTSVNWESSLFTNKKGKQKPFMKESTTIKVHRKEKYFRMIDVDITLCALTSEVGIGGSDDEKGYGGFSVRIKMPDDLKFKSINGFETPQITQIRAGSWMDICGSIDKYDRKGGVVILCHPENPNYPENWILRQKSSMQNPVFPGRERIVLAEKQSVRLRYRLIIHEGSMEGEVIENFAKNYY